MGTTALLRDHVTLMSASLLQVTTHSLLGWELGGILCIQGCWRGTLSSHVGGNSWILS